jgi:hypothetical protein
LDAVEGDFEDDARLNRAHAPVCELLNGVRAKPFGEFGQFHIRQTRISLAHVQQFRVLCRTPHGERVI